jgi:hypothetical protein
VLQAKVPSSGKGKRKRRRFGTRLTAFEDLAA